MNLEYKWGSNGTVCVIFMGGSNFDFDVTEAALIQLSTQWEQPLPPVFSSLPTPPTFRPKETVC